MEESVGYLVRLSLEWDLPCCLHRHETVYHHVVTLGDENYLNTQQQTSNEKDNHACHKESIKERGHMQQR